MNISSERFEITTREKTPCIYAILNNQNYKVYVGQSRHPDRRACQHIFSLKNGTHQNLEMQKDFDKGHNFSFCRLKTYSEDEDETMRFYELKYMKIFRENGFELYNSETDKQIEQLLKFNSRKWELHCLMENKRDDYYRKYFGCTYYQFTTWDMLSKKNGNDSYLKWKIESLNEKRKEEIKKEEREKRKQFLREYKKVSLYVKKDIYEKLKNITDNPEEYINKIIKESISK